MRIPVFVLLSTCFVFGQAPKAQKSHVQSAPIWTQEPDGFKGLPFDSSQADAGSKLDTRGLGCLRLDTDTVSCHITDTDIGSVGTNTRFTFRNGRFVGAGGEFDSSNFETLRDIFIERYGRPHDYQRQTVRNGAGGVFQNETLTWVGKTVTVVLMKYGSTVIEGIFAVSLKSYTAEQVGRDDAAKKKAATAM